MRLYSPRSAAVSEQETLGLLNSGAGRITLIVLKANDSATGCVYKVSYLLGSSS
jgi:hypothetical protein